MNELLIKELDKYIKENLVVKEKKKKPVIVGDIFHSSKDKVSNYISYFEEEDIVEDYTKLNDILSPEMSCKLPELDTLDKIIDETVLDESFSEMVLRKIDEKCITDVACYTKAGLDRKHFSKIRSDKHYKPSKQTALALALALELPINEFEDMLKKAGFALSNSKTTDVIVKFFIDHNNYNISTIDEALLRYDQKPLIKY